MKPELKYVNGLSLCNKVEIVRITNSFRKTYNERSGGKLVEKKIALSICIFPLGSIAEIKQRSLFKFDLFIDCVSDIDECSNNPCHNAGTCTDQLNGFHCICPAGFTGKSCETGMIMQSRVDFCIVGHLCT